MFDFWNLKSIKNAHANFRKLEREIGFQYPVSFWQSFRTEARKVYHRKTFDPLSAPIRGGWRTRCDEDGESMVDYTIIPDNGETDEEILEYIRNSPVFIGSINSPYDCTGKRFTWSYYFHRVPCGIVLYHHSHLDI